jgi:hypothetical protein
MVDGYDKCVHAALGGGLVAIMLDGCLSAALNVTRYGEVMIELHPYVCPGGLLVALSFPSRLVVLWSGAYRCF